MLFVVSCQLLVVSGIVGRRGGNRANQFQVTVQFWAKFIEKGLEFRDGLLCKQPPTVRSAKPVLCLIQRAASIANKSAVVSVSAATHSFGDIRANAISRPHNLTTDCALSKRVPLEGSIPNRISNFLRQPVNPEDSRNSFS